MKKKDSKTAEDAPDARNATDVLNILFLPKNVELENPESWLKSTIEEDSDSRMCQARMLCSELFLQSVLYPLVERGVPINEEVLSNKLVDFKRSSPGSGQDFEASNILGSVLNHFQCYSSNDLDSQLDHSAPLDKDFQLLMTLSELDLKVVDETVLKRLAAR